MDLSFKLASLLDDMDIDYEVIPSEDGGVALEFTYDDSFFNVEFISDIKIIVNGETTTYKNFIIDTF